MPDQISNFELMVMLALIRIGDQAYGVPISQELERLRGRDVVVGSVYAALECLQNRDLVQAKNGEPTPERGGRGRRYFTVTGKGLKVIRDTRRTLMPLWNGIPALGAGRT